MSSLPNISDSTHLHQAILSANAVLKSSVLLILKTAVEKSTNFVPFETDKKLFMNFTCLYK